MYWFVLYTGFITGRSNNMAVNRLFANSQPKQEMNTSAQKDVRVHVSDLGTQYVNVIDVARSTSKVEEIVKAILAEEQEAKPSANK